MGLISYIKEQYYNHKLNKADSLMNDNRSFEAEQIYIYLLDKQPFAAARLAGYYFSLARKADINETRGLFRKILDIEKKAGAVYDASSYNAALQKILEYINQRAESLFKSGSFDDCCSILKVLNDSKHKTEHSLNLYSKSRINQVLKDLSKTKISDSAFSSIISFLQVEWPRGKNIQIVISTVKEFINELISQNRFYVANELLAITGTQQDETTIWNNATQIVYGRDVEAQSDECKKTVLTYGKSIVLRTDISDEDSVSLFENCWKVSKDVNTIMDILKNAQPESRKNALRNIIFDKSEVFLEDKKLLERFINWLSNDNNPETALENLEKINSLGYNVEKFYVRRLHDWITSLANDDRIAHLDHAQVLFPYSTIVIEDKLECAKEYESQKEYDKSISVANSIAQKCNPAYTVKAKALFNKAAMEQTAEKKESLLHKALEAINLVACNNEQLLKNKIMETLVDVANQYYADKQHNRAYNILDKLGKDKFKKAVLSIIRHKETEINAISKATDKLTASNQAINEISSYGLHDIYQDPIYQTIWDIKIASTLECIKDASNTDAVTELNRISKELESAGFDSTTITAKKKNIIAETIKRKYLIARNLEVSNKINEAATLYKEISGLEAKRTPTLSSLRFILCKLKIQNDQDILGHKDMIYNLLRKAAKAFSAEKEDIAYRFALILLKSGEDKEALAILNEFLPSEEYLKKACEQGDIIKAQAKLADFNNKLEAVKNKTLSSDDAVFFINHMLEYAETIKPILNIPRNTLVKYRNKLKNYAIFKLFEEERYHVAFEKMLKEHPDYLDDLSALRNIALTCLNMAESKQITPGNYKEVIAVWLTSIYQEQLFVKTLDYTSWDNQYSFSLYNAYGHFNEYEYDDLPDNVNFDDDSNDSNLILIKNVQRLLLDRFEAAISDNQEYHSFYTSQKDAMDAFIALNLDEKCKLVAPHLAKDNDEIFKDITSALEQDRKQEYENWEDVIAVGAIYQLSDSIYTDYNKAKMYYEDCIAALSTQNITQFTSASVSLIKKFNKLYSALISSTNSKISVLTSQNKNEFKQNFTFYFAICDRIKDKTLSFLFSNYVMSYVVKEVNEVKMKLSEASGYILAAYTLDTSNSRIKENLKTLFEMLCRETNTESNNAVSNILTKVQTRDSSFYRTLNAEYQDAKIAKNLHSIVERVNNQSLSEKDALNQVYDMYIANPENESICNNLAQLAQICIVKYVISDKYHSSSVKSILNKIINNKSSEFKKQSSIFREAYNNIWSQLPSDIKILLDDPTSGVLMGQSLNIKGIRLKEGLELMKQLGGFSTPRSYGLNNLGRYNLPF